LTGRRYNPKKVGNQNQSSPILHYNIVFSFTLSLTSECENALWGHDTNYIVFHTSWSCWHDANTTGIQEQSPNCLYNTPCAVMQSVLDEILYYIKHFIW